MIGLRAIAAGLAGFVLATAAALTPGGSAEGSSHRVATVLPGMSQGDACAIWGQFSWAHRCWHDDEVGSWSGLDFNRWDGQEPGLSVYWNHFGSDWSQVVTVSFSNGVNTNCTGITVTITQPGASGAFNYKHIDPASGVAGSSWQDWFSVPGHVSGTRYLGTVSASQPSGCPWTGAHLHQSGNNASSTSIYTNWYAAESGCGAYLCNWSTGTWAHQIRW